MSVYIPNANEFDVDVDREGFLEGRALLPPSFVRLGEHLVGEGNLLVVACREKANL